MTDENSTARVMRLLKEEGARTVLKALQTELELLHDAPATDEMYRPGLRHALRAVARHQKDLEEE